MSVWGTGREELARGFSWQHRIIEFAAIGYASRLRLDVVRIYLHDALHACSSITTDWYDYLPASPHRLSTTSPGRAIHHVRPEGPSGFWRLASLGSTWALFRGYGNINPLSIDYACRPRLRSRLTLGGLAWPRNPWSFGGGVSHSSFATHACILTRVPSTAGLPRRFLRHTTLPYPSAHLAGRPQTIDRLLRECHSFGGVLEPRYIVGAESLDQ